MSPYPIASSALKKWGFELETSPKSRESLPAEPVNCKLLSTCFHNTLGARVVIGQRRGESQIKLLFFFMYRSK